MSMRVQFTCALICALIACSYVAEAKTIFRRTDKISEKFKQLNLAAEEIDPNVAPLVQQQIEALDTDDVSAPSAIGSAPGEEFIEVPDDLTGTAADEGDASDAAAGADETVNEVDSIVDEASQVVNAPASGASSSSSASASSAAAAVATATTSAPVAAAATVQNQEDASALSKYCKCTDSTCNCCRDIGLPLLPIRGPGCAKISYLGNEKMSVSIKYGDVTLATRTISSKNTKPVCLGLPGGYNQFCGRVYGLSKAKENFKACLGFELRADDEVEAALRVSCFKFGPDGLRVAEAEPLPSEVNKDEDDDDDIFGFGAGGDDTDDYDDEEEDDEPEEADEADEPDEDYEDDDEPEAPEDADYGGFSLASLLDELADDDEETTPAKPAVAATVAVDAPVAGATRNVGVVQSKDDKDSEATATANESGSAVAQAADEPTSIAVTPIPAVGDVVSTTVKTKRSKKAKKNKKKKNAPADSETSFAYELLNGILDFFN